MHNQNAKKEEDTRKIALFYCQNTPESNEQERQNLEDTFRNSIRLFPMPCSGRIEALHLLRALEEFADSVYLVTCPEGACRYFEGNLRAKKRVERAQSIIESIGLEKERIEIVIRTEGPGKTLSDLTEELLDRAKQLPPSPIHAD